MTFPLDITCPQSRCNDLLLPEAVRRPPRLLLRQRHGGCNPFSTVKAKSFSQVDERSRSVDISRRLPKYRLDRVNWRDLPQEIITSTGSGVNKRGVGTISSCQSP